VNAMGPRPIEGASWRRDGLDERFDLVSRLFAQITANFEDGVGRALDAIAGHKPRVGSEFALPG